MSSIILIRHTKPAMSEGLCYGQTDLSYEWEPFHTWQNTLSRPGPNRVYSSPLKRCHDLALKAQIGPICVDTRLLELNFGLWENRLWTELPREDTERWTRDCLRQSPPGGESLQDLSTRVRSFILDLSQGDETHIVFTHAGVIRLLLLTAHGEALDQFFDRSVAFGSIHVLPRRPEQEDFDRLLER